LNPAGTFLVLTALKRNYDFTVTYFFLVSMCDHAGPRLLIFWLHFRPESANDYADDPSPGWRIEFNCDQKFCVQSSIPDNQDRNNGYLDKPGRGCSSDRF